MGKGPKGKRKENPFENPQTMERAGMKLIRNMAFGTFNFYNEGHVFRNIDFCKATINGINKRLQQAGYHLQAMQILYGDGHDPIGLRLLNNDKKTYEAYALALEMIGNIVNSNGDTGFLWVLIKRLPDYKYNI